MAGAGISGVTGLETNAALQSRLVGVFGSSINGPGRAGKVIYLVGFHRP